jgi:hypothetical protein
MQHGGSNGHRKAKQHESDDKQDSAAFHGRRHMVKEMARGQCGIFKCRLPSDRNSLHSIPEAKPTIILNAQLGNRSQSRFRG